MENEIDEIEREHCTCGAELDRNKPKTWEHCGIHDRCERLRAQAAKLKLALAVLDDCEPIFAEHMALTKSHEQLVETLTTSLHAVAKHICPSMVLPGYWKLRELLVRAKEIQP